MLNIILCKKMYYILCLIHYLFTLTIYCFSRNKLHTNKEELVFKTTVENPNILVRISGGFLHEY